MWAALWARIAPYALAAVSLLSILGTIYFKGKSEGKQDEKVKQTKKTLDTVEKRNEIENEIRRAPSGDAAERLRDSWSRD